MNTANLQVAGVLAALGTTLDLLRRKGVLTRAEIDEALAEAEETLLHDPQRPAEVSRSNVEAMCFPIRYLRAANASVEHGAASARFTALATTVGLSKPG